MSHRARLYRVLALPGAIAIADSVGDLPQRPDLVLDCAGHAGLREHGPDILAAGIDLYSVSAGALADADLYRDLSDAARRGGTALRKHRYRLGDSLCGHGVRGHGVLCVLSWRGIFFFTLRAPNGTTVV